jgi:NAD(P)-dependent dehydrogenase (short-subunit alcohol dehydrogenase family)
MQAHQIRRQSMSDSRTVLITGSNSGFGRLTAETLATKGHTVFASMREVSGKNAEQARALRAWAEAKNVRLHVIELDVADDKSVARAVHEALATAGRIDAVVNNAAVGAFGLVESFTSAQMRNLFEVNVFGVQRVNRAVLPHMRERRSGLLVHISSGLGRLALPVTGAYSMTKWALEGLAETYRYELAAVGVDSVIVQPGAFPTEFGGKALAAAEPERAQGYGPSADLPQRLMAGFGAMFAAPNPPQPQEVADAIAGLIEMPAGTRPLRTVVDRMTGQGPTAINEVASNVMAGALQMMGMGELLTVKP